MGTWKFRNEPDLHRLGDIAVRSPSIQKVYLQLTCVYKNQSHINPSIQQRLHTRRHLHLENQVAHSGRIDESAAMDDSAYDSNRQIASISICQSRRSERMERIQNEPLKLYSTLLASKRHRREWYRLNKQLTCCQSESSVKCEWLRCYTGILHLSLIGEMAILQTDAPVGSSKW